MVDIAVQERARTEATIRLAARGDEAAFARLVAAHHASMARVAYAVAGDAELARDAVQSAWTIAWRRLGNVREPGRLNAWLVAVAANEARKALRRRRRVAVVDISVAWSESGASDPVDAISVVDLERALRRLPADDRMLLALRFVAGLDSGAIGDQLGISASGVRSRLSRLLDRLRLELGDD